MWSQNLNRPPPPMWRQNLDSQNFGANSPPFSPAFWRAKCGAKTWAGGVRKWCGNLRGNLGGKIMGLKRRTCARLRPGSFPRTFPRRFPRTPGTPRAGVSNSLKCRLLFHIGPALGLMTRIHPSRLMAAGCPLASTFAVAGEGTMDSRSATANTKESSPPFTSHR